MQEPEEDQHGT